MLLSILHFLISLQLSGHFALGNSKSSKGLLQSPNNSVELPSNGITFGEGVCKIPEQDAISFRTAWTDLFDPRAGIHERINSITGRISSALSAIPVVGGAMSGVLNMFQLKSTDPSPELKCLAQIDGKLTEIRQELKNGIGEIKQEIKILEKKVDQLSRQLQNSTNIIMNRIAAVETRVIEAAATKNSYAKHLKLKLVNLNQRYQSLFDLDVSATEIAQFNDVCLDTAQDPLHIAIFFESIFFKECADLQAHNTSGEFRDPDITKDDCLPAIYMQRKNFTYEAATTILNIASARTLEIMELQTACATFFFHRANVSANWTVKKYNITTKYVVPTLEFLGKRYVYQVQLRQINKVFDGLKAIFDATPYDVMKKEGLSVTRTFFNKIHVLFYAEHQYALLGIRNSTNLPFIHCTNGPWCMNVAFEKQDFRINFTLIQMPNQKFEFIKNTREEFRDKHFENITKMILTEGPEKVNFKDKKQLEKYGVFDFTELSYFFIAIHDYRAEKDHHWLEVENNHFLNEKRVRIRNRTYALQSHTMP